MILRRLNRSLVYSTIDSALATSICVNGTDTIFDDVLLALHASAPIASAIRETDASSSLGSLQKHGILDLTFRVTLALPGPPPAGIGVLRSLGLADSADVGPPDWDHHFLAEFAEDAEAGALYLKVFLRTPERVPIRESVRRLRDGLPSDFWPHNFVVDDACLTNVKSIWIAKHVYV